ncbi:uncharacterized protein BYT42DRAFT_580792 [Radiomyces spectabilis]|uniref:uncharacterized protein n=1 Tax=Radiomyces spectabilis TaxID=64574 RepID=UPI002220CC95|nr:uncharacterized protein BYT42DRAFT_580792 [Radiomyces spectabilis]KAI8371589.1 hypothetical protein BYT42DRAFT_580792 [Radiomyces spectabilis]
MRIFWFVFFWLKSIRSIMSENMTTAIGVINCNNENNFITKENKPWWNLTLLTRYVILHSFFGPLRVQNVYPLFTTEAYA